MWFGCAAVLISGCERSGSGGAATVELRGEDATLTLSEENAPLEAEVADGTWECLELRQGSAVPLKHCGERPEMPPLVVLAGGGQLTDARGSEMIFSAVVGPAVTAVELVDPSSQDVTTLRPIPLGDSDDGAVVGLVRCEGDPCSIQIAVETRDDSSMYEFNLLTPFGQLVPIDEET